MGRRAVHKCSYVHLDICAAGWGDGAEGDYLDPTGFTCEYFADFNPIGFYS